MLYKIVFFVCYTSLKILSQNRFDTPRKSTSKTATNIPEG